MTTSPILHLYHRHEVPVLTAHIHTVHAPRTSSSLTKVTAGTTPIDVLNFNRLELFFNLALTSSVSDNWHELNFQMVGLMYLLGRHLDIQPGLVVSSASKAGGRTSKIALADYLKSGFAGQLGAGLAALHARHLGAMYIAHVEDVDDRVTAQLKRVYLRAAPASKSGSGAPRMSTRKGDFLTVNRRHQLGMLEAKATTGSGTSQTFLNKAVVDGAVWQVDPFMAGELLLLGGSGPTGPAAIIEQGLVSGLNINESPAGAAIHAIHLALPHGPPVLSGVSAGVVASSHFQSWWQLFKLTFHELALPESNFDLPVVEVGTMSFVLGFQTDDHFPFAHGLRLEGWATYPFAINPAEERVIAVGIEENIFRELLATFERRRVAGTDTAEGGPEAIHAAVGVFQRQLRNQEGIEQADETGWQELQAFQETVQRVVAGQREGSEAATAVFREGVIAFTSPLWYLPVARTITVLRG